MAYMFWQLMHAIEPYLTDALSEEMKVARTTTISDLNRLDVYKRQVMEELL